MTTWHTHLASMIIFPPFSVSQTNFTDRLVNAAVHAWSSEYSFGERKNGLHSRLQR